MYLIIYVTYKDSARRMFENKTWVYQPEFQFK